MAEEGRKLGRSDGPRGRQVARVKWRFGGRPYARKACPARRRRADLGVLTPRDPSRPMAVDASGPLVGIGPRG